MAKEVIVSAKKIKKRKRLSTVTKTAITILIVLLTFIFAVLNVAFGANKFTVTLSRDLETNKGIIIYEHEDDGVNQRILYADPNEKMSDMTLEWLPQNIHSESTGGSHNAKNYIAYTFYVENQGEQPVSYWYQIDLKDVIKDVDEAVRVVVYLNDNERLVYAKKSKTGEPEEGTIPFYNEEKNIMVLNERKDFKVKEIDKFTIVIFLEGNDPECVNNIIGGELKMAMNITEEYVDWERYEKK